MPPASTWLADSPSASAAVPHAVFDTSALPPGVAAALWRGDQLGAPVATVHPSGFHALDAELPGGGWPGHSLTEILSPQSATLEWRLLGPALARVTAAGRSVVVVGPPRSPHLPGLRLAGLSERLLIWVQAETPAERLWSAEQLVKANAGGALLVWLPQVRPEQVRRLQVLAAGHEGPVFLCRPSTAALESSAAPLRLLARVGADWALQVDCAQAQGAAAGQHAAPALGARRSADHPHATAATAQRLAAAPARERCCASGRSHHGPRTRTGGVSHRL